MPEVAKEDEVQPASEWFLKTFSPLHFQQRFLYYGTGGLYDPKNYTLEPYLLSGAGDARFWRWDKARWAGFGRGFIQSQLIAFGAFGLIGAIWDPLGRDEGAGLDELVGDIFDWGIPESKAEAKDMATGFAVGHSIAITTSSGPISNAGGVWAVERSVSPYWYPGQGLNW